MNFTGLDIFDATIERSTDWLRDLMRELNWTDYRKSYVALRFVLPGAAEAIAVRGVVRHTNGFRHGFEFLDLSSVQCAQINAFLAQARRRVSRKFPPLRERRNGYKADKAVNLVPDLPSLA